jgi:hypothetical protein
MEHFYQWGYLFYLCLFSVSHLVKWVLEFCWLLFYGHCRSYWSSGSGCMRWGRDPLVLVSLLPFHRILMLDYLLCRCVVFLFSLGAEHDRVCHWVIQSGQDLCAAWQFRYRSFGTFTAMRWLIMWELSTHLPFILGMLCLFWPTRWLNGTLRTFGGWPVGWARSFLQSKGEMLNPKPYLFLASYTLRYLLDSILLNWV